MYARMFTFPPEAEWTFVEERIIHTILFFNTKQYSNYGL